MESYVYSCLRRLGMEYTISGFHCDSNTNSSAHIPWLMASVAVVMCGVKWIKFKEMVHHSSSLPGIKATPLSMAIVAILEESFMPCSFIQTNMPACNYLINYL